MPQTLNSNPANRKRSKDLAYGELGMIENSDTGYDGCVITKMYRGLVLVCGNARNKAFQSNWLNYEPDFTVRVLGPDESVTLTN
jgi:hypothetical protein